MWRIRRRQILKKKLVLKRPRSPWLFPSDVVIVPDSGHQHVFKLHFWLPSPSPDFLLRLQSFSSVLLRRILTYTYHINNNPRNSRERTWIACYHGRFFFFFIPNKHARTFDYDGEFMNHPSGFARAEGMLVAKMIVSVPGGLILNLRDEEFLRVFSSLIPKDHKSNSYYYSNSFIGHKSCGRLSEIISTD